MASFYSVGVQKKECKVVIRARDVDAKQVLFGWGEGRGPAAEFYGRGTGRGAGDSETWEWKLSSNGIRELRMVLAQGVETGRERRAAEELLKKIDKQASKLRTCKVR